MHVIITRVERRGPLPGLRKLHLPGSDSSVFHIKTTFSALPVDNNGRL
jgi:hypothetical protein